MAWFENHYRCWRCKEQWSDNWSCCCDDECPSCGATCTPSRSEDLSVIVEGPDPSIGETGFAVLASPDTAEETPDYQTVAIAETRRSAEMVANCVRRAR